MVNVTHDEPFQFHAVPYSMHRNDSSPDASFDTPSQSSNPNYEGYEHSPDSGGRRGRHNSRRRSRRSSPLIQAISQRNGPRGGPSTSGLNGNRNGSGSGSSDTRRPRRRSLSHNGGTPRGRRRGGRVSRSSSRDGGDSLRSGYSADSYPYDPSYDHYYGDGYDYDDDDTMDPDEEAHIRRLHGPKLNVRILPLPAREAEIAEEEERIRQEEEVFAGRDGDITPVQERISIALTPGTQPPEQISVQPLSAEDHDAVSHFTFYARYDAAIHLCSRPSIQIVALSDALWKALEDGLRIREPAKVIHRWED